MGAADVSAADGETVPSPGQPYSLLVRLHAGGVGHIAILRKPGRDGRPADQSCRKLNRVVDILPRRTPEDDTYDWYLGLNSFKRATRRAEHLLNPRDAFVASALTRWRAHLAKFTIEALWTDHKGATSARKIKSGLSAPVPRARSPSPDDGHLDFNHPETLAIADTVVS